jgi:hypothetical protein
MQDRARAVTPALFSFLLGWENRRHFGYRGSIESLSTSVPALKTLCRVPTF